MMARIRIPPEVIAKLPPARDVARVAALINQRKSTAEIAQILNLSVYTIKVRRAVIYRTMVDLGCLPSRMNANRQTARKRTRTK